MTTTILVASSTVSVYQSSPVVAHNFSTNESAAFLALTDALKAETQLVQQSIEKGDLSSAGEHADRAMTFLNDNTTKEIAERNQRLADDLNASLATLRTSTTNPNMANDINFTVSDLNSILDEIVTARIDPDKSNNSTIQALRLIELLDKLLTNYGNAYGVDFDMTNMSMMMAMSNGGGNDGTNNISSTNMNMGNEGGANMSMSRMVMNDNSSASGSAIVNTIDYETAQAIANKINKVFNDELTNASSEMNSTTTGQSINNIDSAIRELVAKVGSEAPAMDVMTIVHTKIHPNLIAVFNLTLK
jgi:hypothetical protein